MTVDVEQGMEYARRHGPLRDSRIVGVPIDVKEDGTPVGFRLQVQLARGQHAGDVERAVPLIAAMYHTIPDGVRVLSVGDHSRCIVEVIQSTQVIGLRKDRVERLHSVHPWTHPTLDLATGRWQLAVNINDGNPVHGTLWIPGQGTRPLWAPGDPGGGKTASVAASLLSVTGHGIVSPWVIDGQDGASLGEWRDVAPRFAGDVASAREVFKEANAVMDARSTLMSKLNRKCLDPSPEMPIILVPVDEAPEFADDKECMFYVDRISRKGRKVLVVIWWINQMANGSKGFAAGSLGAILRGILKSANVMLFRADGTTAKTAMSGFGAVDTTVIPVGVAGAMLFGGPAHPSPVLARSLFEADPYAAAKRAVLPDVESATRATGNPEPARVSLIQSEDTVLTWIRANGPARNGAVIGALCGPDKLSAATVNRALASLEQSALIHKRNGKHGEWEAS